MVTPLYMFVKTHQTVCLKLTGFYINLISVKLFKKLIWWELQIPFRGPLKMNHYRTIFRIAMVWRVSTRHYRAKGWRPCPLTGHGVRPEWGLDAAVVQGYSSSLALNFPGLPFRMASHLIPALWGGGLSVPHPQHLGRRRSCAWASCLGDLPVLWTSHWPFPGSSRVVGHGSGLKGHGGLGSLVSDCSWFLLSPFSGAYSR